MSKKNNSAAIGVASLTAEKQKTNKLDKLKHWMYNSVKNAQSALNSKTNISLDTDEFFKPKVGQKGNKGGSTSQQTLLLHERYINSTGSRALELKALNDRFAAAFESITWFSYRDNLEAPLLGTSHRSDTGWGCMLRTGQMILF